MERVDDRSFQVAGLLKLWIQLLGPEDLHALGGECAADEGPVGFDEAQDSVDGYPPVRSSWTFRSVGVEDVLDDIDLLADSLDHLGAVAGADEEPLGPRAEEAAFDFEVGSAVVLLRVDDPDTGRGDGDVVDVCSAAWNPAVVEYAEGVVAEFVQLCAQAFFSQGACVPRLGRLGVVGESEDEAAELGVLGADGLFPALVSAFVFASCRRSWCSNVDWRGHLRCACVGVAGTSVGVS